MATKVLLAGGTGLVGSLVRTRLDTRRDVDLLSLVRQGSATAGHPVDFEQLAAAPATVLGPLAPQGIDVAISCLGTTLRAAGSEAAMARVDHDYVFAVASGARALGARQFILVSSVGAGGPGFYLQTKGAIEQAVVDLGFDRVDLVRPSLLLGRHRDRRPLEAFGQALLGLFSPIMAGPLSRYAAIRAETVAEAIVALIGAPGTGRHVHEKADLEAIS